MESSQLSFQEVNGELIIIFNETEALADENADELTEEVIQKRSKKRKGKRAEDLSGLPKEIINHDLSEDEFRALYPDEEWNKLPDEVYHRYSLCYTYTKHNLSWTGLILFFIRRIYAIEVRCIVYLRRRGRMWS